MTLLNAASSGPRNGCYGDVRQLADLGVCLPAVQKVTPAACQLAGCEAPVFCGLCTDSGQSALRPGDGAASNKRVMEHERPAEMGFVIVFQGRTRNGVGGFFRH
jgi:hypothetical protein